ncbi:MAG: N-methyl-L-tryptophan oxidase [Phycisphaerales bacterium]|nr:N-methyl-L-tryptophan oxidase [Phycisphaerales bacterium]
MAGPRIVVVGVGTMGSAACAHLAQRGAQVIGLERFTIGHEFGSHGGQSRAFRLAYYEHPDYVPLLKRSRDLWLSLNERTARPIYQPVGGVYLAAPGADFVRLAHAAAVEHGLDVELLDAADVRDRFPIFRVPEDWIALVERPAGFVVPEWAIEAHAQIARQHGAQLRDGVQVHGWSANGAGVQVDTTEGSIEADGLVLTAGVWSRELAQVEGLGIRPSRQVLGWVDAPEAAPVDLGQLPVWALELEDTSVLYGFPRMSGLPGPTGFKIARHWPAATINPDDLDRSTHPDDADDFMPHLREFLPGAEGEVRDMRICLYGNSADGHFRTGRHPESDAVVVAAGFSGHGMKFQPVIGEILADLALEGTTPHAIDFISL